MKRALTWLKTESLSALVELMKYLIWLGVILWFVSFLAFQDGLSGRPNSFPTGTPFTLAQVVAIFGAFGLAGGFSSYGDAVLRRKLRRVGIIYLLSSLAFATLGLLLSGAAFLLVEGQHPAVAVVMAALIFVILMVAAGCLAAGTFDWLSVIGKLLSNGKEEEEPKHCSPCSCEEPATTPYGTALIAEFAAKQIEEKVNIEQRREDRGDECLVRPVHNIAAGIIRRGDEVLLVQQQGADDPVATWSLPGGVAEPGEMLSEALIREVREETGLPVVDIGPLAYVVQHDNRAPVQLGRPVTGDLATAFVFEVETWTGTVRHDDPDGYVLKAEFVPVEWAVTTIRGQVPSVMFQPMASYLGDETSPGAVWHYRTSRDGSGADSPLAQVPGPV